MRPQQIIRRVPSKNLIGKRSNRRACETEKDYQSCVASLTQDCSGSGIYGEKGWLTEIGGQSKMGCLPIGAKVFLLYVPAQQLPIQVIAIGTVKAI